MKRGKGGLLQSMLAVLLSAVLVTGMVSNAAPMTVLAEEASESGTCGDNLTWTLADGVLTISGSGVMENYNSIMLPPWDGNKTDIVSVIIENGVTGIGIAAFCGCRSLTSVTIADSVESINDRAFYQCSSLTDVIMQGETPPAIGSIAVFWQCKFFEKKTTGIHVPKGTAEDYKSAWDEYEMYITDHYHSWAPVWTTNETHHWHECIEQDCPVTGNADKDGYGAHVYDNDSDTTCNTCNYIRMLPDTQPPTGEIKIESHSWTGFLGRDEITFNLFFKETKQVTITAQDTGTGVDKIYYYMSDRAMTKTQVEGLSPWTEGTSFSIVPDGKYVIYVKITDKAGNVTYLSSDGLVLDATPPIIAGVTDGKVYNTPQTVTVTDMYNVKSVTVDGTEVALTGVPPSQFTLGIAEKPQTIVATDYAGNTATVTVTVQAQTYAVTVQNGTGGGNYEAGATVTIAANAPASGKQFDKWVVNSGGVTLADSMSSTTTFTMPAGAVAVTAAYKDSVSDADKVAAAKTVVENALAGITATNDTTQAEILGVINTALSNAGIAGVTVEIDKFRKQEASTSTAGYIEGVVFIGCGQESKSVNMEKLIAQLTAEKYTVTVNSGTGGGNYEAGATVTIAADTPASGKQFDKWVVNSGSVTLADATSSTTTFTMPAGAVAVTAVYKDIAEEHIHNYGEWITDQEATAAEAGTRHRECQTCGYRQTETIPATGTAPETGTEPGTGTEPATGTVTPEVKPGDNVPATNISTSSEELKDILLTDEERQQVQNGTNIRIVLEVQDAGNTVNASDEAAVAQALNGFTVGQYLNIDLYKLTGADRTNITETARKIRIVITVPDSLKNADSSETRTFVVIRVHDGRAELLTDLDGSADTITIETDRFSTYAIGYKDTKPDSAKDNEPKTEDFTPIELYATLAMIAGFAYLLLYFADRERGMTEETKKELVSRLVRWAKRGGRLRRYLALAAIFVLLVYYHSIGKKTCVEWKEMKSFEIKEI